MTDERLYEHHRHHLHASDLWDRAMTYHRTGIPVVPRLLMRRLRARYGADLPLWESRPPEMYLLHNAQGTVIHPATSFEGPVIIFHQTTFGNAWTHRRDGAPRIGPYVFVGAGAKVLGDIRIGAFSVVSANAVVTRDVPDGHLVTPNGDLRLVDRSRMLRTYFGLDAGDVPGASRDIIRGDEV